MLKLLGVELLLILHPRFTYFVFTYSDTLGKIFFGANDALICESISDEFLGIIGFFPRIKCSVPYFVTTFPQQIST